MKIVIAPDNKLRVKTKRVKKITPKLLSTIKEMVKLTKTFEDPEGVGLASTQIGDNEQFFIAKLSKDKFKAYFNPKILSSGKTTRLFFEGCLSIPDYYGEVRRSASVKVVYTNEKGQEVKESLSGIPAWIFQHEYDHLNGKLFIDHCLAQKSRIFKTVGKDRAGADIFEEVIL